MTQLGPYVLLEELGRGGMGSVWRAHDPGLDRVVAVKVLLAPLASPAELERFRREALAQARLRHPAIVGVLGHGATPTGQPYLVLELVEGESLAARLKRDGPLDPRAAMRVVASVARAVHYAHSRGVLHRDLKASNVLLAADGGALLIDFGLAALTGAERLTATGETLGTPGRMAPEQVMGERGRIGPKTDVYGLGALLYEALTGRPPFEAPSLVALLTAVVERSPTRPSATAGRPLDPRLDALVLRCLQKDPAQRWPSAEALAVALEALLEPRPPPPGPARVRAAAAAAALVALGAAAARLVAGDGPAPAVLAESPGALAAVTSVEPPRVAPPAAPVTSAGVDRAAVALDLLAEARVAAARNDLPTARRLLDGALALGAPWQALHARALVRARLGDQAGVSEDLRALGARSEPEALVLAARGLALTDDQEGLAVTERAVAATGSLDARALGARALARAGRDERAGALADAEAALRLDEAEVVAALALGTEVAAGQVARLEAARDLAVAQGDLLAEATVRCVLAGARVPEPEAAETSALLAGIEELDRSLRLAPGLERALRQRANLELVVATRGPRFDRELLRRAADDASRLCERSSHAVGDVLLLVRILSYLALDPQLGVERRTSERARAALSAGLERSPKTPALLVARAELAASLGDVFLAANDALMAVTELERADDPGLADRATALLGRLRWQRGAPDEAVALLTRFIDARGGDAPLALAERALSRLVLHQAQQASADVARALSLAPKQPRVQFAAGRLYTAEADLLRAARAYEEARRLAPNFAQALGELALVQLGLRQLDARQAQERVLRVAGLEPWSASHLVSLAALVAASDAAEADVLLDKAVALEPALGEPRVNRGRRRLERDPQGALTDLLFATERLPWSADAWCWLGHARRRLADPAGALQDAERSVTLAEGQSGAQGRAVLAEGLRLRGRLRLDQRQLDGGRADADRVVGLDPGSAESWWLRARARRLQGDEPGSLADLEEAVRRRPSVAYRLDLAEALLRGDEAQRARARAELDALERSLDPQHPELGRVRALQARQGR